MLEDEMQRQCHEKVLKPPSDFFFFCDFLTKHCQNFKHNLSKLKIEVLNGNCIAKKFTYDMEWE